MGRYYNGDINGKFWFAVQSSDAADRFGVTGTTPNYINYYFDSEDLAEVENELGFIKEELGTYFELVDDFFANANMYNETDIINLGVPKDKVKKVLSDYADYCLGVEIRDCIKTNGSCEFEAEL